MVPSDADRGIARELRLGHIPVRLSSEWMDGYGYPVSVCYGDLLLYLPALMNLLGFSVTTSYKFYVFLINVGTTAISYYSMKRICRDTRIALIATLAYCTASYRMINIYARAAVGEYSAMMFMPLMAAAVWRIYMDDVRDYRQYRKNALLLAVGMSGLFMTHMLSAEMVAFAMLFVCIALFRKTIRRETVKVYLLAVAGTCVLSAYFIVPFLDYVFNVPLHLGEDIANVAAQEYGMTVGEYFTFFRKLDYNVISEVSGRRLMSPGLVLMTAFLVAVPLCAKTKDKVLRFLTVAAGLTMCITLTVFPWDYLADHCILFKIMAQVQFPYRYIGIAMIFLCLLLVQLLRGIRTDSGRVTRAGWTVAGAALVMTGYFASAYVDGCRLVAPYGRAELDTYHMGNGEYLRSEINDSMLQNLSSDVDAEHMKEAVIVERRGSSMRLHCVASDEEKGLVDAPMFYYKGYHVTDDSGREYAISDGYAKRIEFSLPPGFDGYINIEYREPWYWRVAEAISLVSALGLAAVVFRWKGMEKKQYGQKSLAG